jgi:L-asparaginase
MAKANVKGKFKAHVYVLYTGGTFGMHHDPKIPGGPLTPMEAAEIIPKLPEFEDIGIRVKFDKLENLLDSSSMTPNEWILIAQRIKENYDKYDGFVIIHGTDTLSYTASALSFMFENLAKPIVVTGSQLPLINARTDARLNYGHAVMIAGYLATDLPLIPEVIVVFADKILRGCRTRKMSASAWTGFESPNAPTLGEIGEHVRIYENQIRPAPARDLDVQLNTELQTEVLDISLYPGLRVNHLREILNLDDVKGVVLRTYGSGNAPESPEFLEALRNGIENGNKTVVNITQCPQGSVEMGLYASSVGLLDNGVISGLDMTPEAALAKLMVILGTRIGGQVALQMQINQRGEQSQNLFDLVYKEPNSGKVPNGNSTLVEKSSHVEKYSETVQPDRRFNGNDLSTAVLRIKNLKINFNGENSDNPAIYVFMNAPNVKLSNDVDSHPRLVNIINLTGRDSSKNIAVVETLSKERIKNIIGDSDIAITLLATDGVKFTFEKLSLSLFTRT